MNMRNTLLGLTVLFASSAALALPEIRATVIKGGTWIEISEDGMPVEEALVNNGFVTDEHGRVFINNLVEHSQNLVFYAVTPDGDILETQVFHPNRRNLD